MSLLRKVYSKVKCYFFKKQFKAIGHKSGFGDWGYGDTCHLIGMKKCEIGDSSWFGRQCELIVNIKGADPIRNSSQITGHGLIIGNYVSCASRCRITCANEIIIGNHVLLAPDVFITDHNHGMKPSRHEDYASQPLEINKVHIKDNVWLGQRVVVLPGVTIGEFSIIGANSVVTHDIPPYSIAVGSPARVVKQWSKERKEWVPLEGSKKRGE